MGAPVNDFDSAAYRFIIGVGLPIIRRLTKTDWRGTEFVPKTGPCITAANHTSYFDPLAVGQFLIDGCHRRPRYLGKREIVEMPVFGRLFQAAGQIPVHRNTTNAINAYKDAIDALEQGHCIAIYPEGTTTQDPDNWPMVAKTGAARLALTTGAPVIPIAQWGAEQVIPNQDKFELHLFPIKTMQVRAGAPVDLDDLRDRPITSELLTEASERIMHAITNLLAEMRGETPPAERYNPRKHRGGAAN